MHLYKLIIVDKDEGAESECRLPNIDLIPDDLM